jgi:hypothetical protein
LPFSLGLGFQTRTADRGEYKNGTCLSNPNTDFEYLDKEIVSSHISVIQFRIFNAFANISYLNQMSNNKKT